MICDYSSGSWWFRPSSDRLGRENGKTLLISDVRWLGSGKRLATTTGLWSRLSLSQLGFLKAIHGALVSSTTFSLKVVMRLFLDPVGRLIGWWAGKDPLQEPFQGQESLGSGSKGLGGSHMWDSLSDLKITGYTPLKETLRRRGEGTGTGFTGGDD